MVVEWKEDDEDFSISFTPSKLSHVILSGEHLVSTGAIRLLLDNDVGISYLDSFGNPIGYLFPHKKSKHIELWEKQIRMDSVHSLKIAISICRRNFCQQSKQITLRTFCNGPRGRRQYNHNSSLRKVQNLGRIHKTSSQKHKTPCNISQSI